MAKKGQNHSNCSIPAIAQSANCIVRLHFNKERKKNTFSVQIVLATEFGVEKELFTEKSSHTGVVPAAPWAAWLQTFNYL